MAPTAAAANNNCILSEHGGTLPTMQLHNRPHEPHQQHVHHQHCTSSRVRSDPCNDYTYRSGSCSLAVITRSRSVRTAGRPDAAATHGIGGDSHTCNNSTTTITHAYRSSRLMQHAKHYPGSCALAAARARATPAAGAPYSTLPTQACHQSPTPTAAAVNTLHMQLHSRPHEPHQQQVHHAAHCPRRRAINHPHQQLQQ
jgi:hypothetical protein